MECRTGMSLMNGLHALHPKFEVGVYASSLVISLLLFFQVDVHAGVSFSGDWEKGLTGNGNWLYIQRVSSNRFQRVTSPVRQGQYAARVEVRPGDDPLISSGERAEVLTMSDSAGNSLDENLGSGTQFYAFSFRLDPNWQSPGSDTNGNGKWALVFQLHGPDTYHASPAIAVSVQDHLSLDFYSGDIDTPSNMLQWADYPLSDNSLPLGYWADLVMRVKFATNFTGAVTVWRRNEGQTNFLQELNVTNIPTLQYKSSLGGVGGHYWKHGLYRAKQPANGVTNVLWLDGMTRGSSYDSVVKAAFNVSPPPVTIVSCAVTSDVVMLSWQGTADRSYDIESCTNLLKNGWAALCSNIVATSSAVVYSNLINQASPSFYRVRQKEQ
jgi:hypothetical protein